MNKQVLVISANGGVGLAVTRAMIAHGCRVTATVSRPEKHTAFLAQLPGCERVITLDLSRAENVRKKLAKTIAGMDRLDAVINCAATSPFAPAEFVAFDTFRHVMEVNCLGNLAIYQAAMPALRQSRGRLIMISSFSGRVATPMMSAYCASKFALEGLADTMRQEAGEWGVEIILLQPGNIDTPVVRQARDVLDAAIPVLPQPERELYGKLYAQMQYRVHATLDAGGIMPPEKVAEAALEALEAAEPEPRYPVGADAELLIQMSHTRSDRDIDALVLDIYRSAPV